ncbi:2763_t:CDS:2, partial [Gigaspora margarita]
EETLDHLITLDQYLLLEILTNKDIPEDQQRMFLTRGIIKLDVKKKLEELDFGNKMQANHYMEKKNKITTKTKRKKRDKKIHQKSKTTNSMKNLMNCSKLKKNKKTTRKSDWKDCLRI